jgi:hypothetical protein
VPTAAKVVVTGDAACTKAADAAGAKATCASGDTTDVAATKAAHVTPAKASTHMASTKAAAMATTTAAAAAGLGTGSKQAAGEHGTRQNHHHSSFHDILLWDGRTVRRRSFQTPAFSKSKRQRRDAVKMAMQMPRLY